MLTPLKSEIRQVSDLTHEARRFRTILWSFERNIDLLFRHSGYEAVVDHEALAQAFSRWRLSFDHAKYLAEVNRHDFVIFAAGLMLKELIAAAPLKALAQTGPDQHQADQHQPDQHQADQHQPDQHQADQRQEGLALIDHRLGAWPEGYAYTSFCLSVAGAILQEMGDEIPASTAVADDPAFWASFRENTQENPALAIAFFDLVCGEVPNWQAPDIPWARALMEKHQAQLAQQNLGALRDSKNN